MAAEPASGSAEAMQQLSQSLRSRFKEAERLQQKQSASGGLGTGHNDDGLVGVLWEALQLSVCIAVSRKQGLPDNESQVSKLRDLCFRIATMGAPRSACADGQAADDKASSEFSEEASGLQVFRVGDQMFVHGDVAGHPDVVHAVMEAGGTLFEERDE